MKRFSVYLKLFILAVMALLVFVMFHIGKENNEGAPPASLTEQRLPDSISETDLAPLVVTGENIANYSSLEDLKKYLYTIESDTFVTEEDLNVGKLMAVDLTVDLDTADPKILVFHTHSQEAFIDSTGTREDSILGIGDELCRVLEEDYNIKTIHDDGQYDVADGIVKISGAYERMEPRIQKILEENPEIEVCIDLHRDILPSNEHLLWDNDGSPTARIMYFNGMSRLFKDGEITDLEHLPNPNLMENLAFSMQMKLISNEKYPEFTRKNYIRAYRYSLHMKGKSLLIELGSDRNTVEEAYNAVKPLAEILVNCIAG